MLSNFRKISIPPQEQILKAFQNFEKENWFERVCDDVDKYINDLDAFFISNLGFVFNSLRISNTHKVPQKVYRLRKYDKKINHFLISEFSHPPASITKMQRANLEGFPIFYCSPSAHTALYEMLQLTFVKGEDNLYFLSEWSFRPDEPIYVSPFIYGEYDRVDVYNKMSKKAFEDLCKELQMSDDDELRRFQEILHFLSRCFEKKDNHHLSSYLAHKHLYHLSNIRTDLMIYPSIQTDKSSMNFAIHPNAVFHKMLLERIFLFKIEDFSYGELPGQMNVAFDIQDKLGINNKHGYLIWRNLPDEDLIDFKNLFPDNKAS